MPPPTEHPEAVGALDGYSDGTLFGWARIPHDPTARVEVELVVDGAPRGRFRADALRADLRDVGWGDGRYGFTIPICHHAPDGTRVAEVRLPDGRPLSGSPLDLVATLHAHKRALRALLSSAPFRVMSFTFNGRDLEIRGVYQPMTTSLAEASFLLDGVPADEVSFAALDRGSPHPFWYLDPDAGDFHARFDLGGRPGGGADTFSFSVGNPREPLDPLRVFHLPVSAREFSGLPDAARMRRVAGHQDAVRFVVLARSSLERIRMLAELHGRPLGSMARVLDWGVGCGRMARLVLEHHPEVELHGVDIDADNVGWCRAHLPGGRFQVSLPMPPLPFPDDHFDFVYAISVFTHLTEAAQDAWLHELARILRPGGLGLATIHGETTVAYLRWPLPTIARWNERGIDDEAIDWAMDGFIPDARSYRSTFHTADYVQGHWSRQVAIRGIHPHVFGFQDAVMFAKP